MVNLPTVEEDVVEAGAEPVDVPVVAEPVDVLVGAVVAWSLTTT